MSKYPASLDDLIDQAQRRGRSREVGHAGVPRRQAAKLDPWGNDYQYAAPGKHNTDGFDVWSNGPDGQSGTDDDIGNWDK